MDYGADHAVGNSFHVCPLQLEGGVCQPTFSSSLALSKGHALADPFDCPGHAALASNVDFAYLAEALNGTGTSLSFSL